MKRFLSLVLTLVMVMSLVTVSAGAKDFTDDDKITYDEAVAVISEIGVVDGDKDGSFRPTDTLTRQAAAKIICNLILGPTTAAELHADTAPYRDVPVNNQFAGYIAYCQAKGIISGYADGSFRPTGTLTGYAFMKMLLGALGYDASLENYVGANWSINVAKQALGIGLNKGLVEEFNGIKAVTRQEAALYAFNTLQADLVEYGQRLTTNVNGTEVTLSSGGAQSRPWKSQQTRIDSIRKDEIVQFAEEYFSKLVKAPDSDLFERPAHTWTYDKKVQIGTWPDKDKLVETYTAGVTGRDLYDLLGSATIRDFDLLVYVDGHAAGNDRTKYDQYTNLSTYYRKNASGVRELMKESEVFTAKDLVRSNTDNLGITANGVLTEVYLDKDTDEIIVVSIHTWLAKATSAYNETREDASLKVFTSSATGTTKTVNVEDVAEVVDVENEDFYLVTMSDKQTEKLEVAEIAEPEILGESTVTKFTTVKEKDSSQTEGRSYPSKLTTGGNEYKKSNTAIYDADTLDLYDEDLLSNNTYNVYVDKYGYFIGVDLFEGAKQYVFVTGYDMRNSNLSVQTANAAGIFLDGTMENITVNVKDTNKNIKNMVSDKDSNSVSNPDHYVDVLNSQAYYKEWGVHASDGVYLLNRWYTYTKTEAGVYTLKPCVGKNGAAMMLASKTVDDLNDEDSTMKLNCARLKLDSVVDTSATNATGGLLIGETMSYENHDGTAVLDGYRAYGEDESMFITVDVGEVSAWAGRDLKVTKAITDVNGVYTGVQDVDIVTKTTDRVVGQYYRSVTLNPFVGTKAVAGNTYASSASGSGDALKDSYQHWVQAKKADGTDEIGYSYLGENAYAVFDNNHFIIGAVILGEAEGSNATKAYILDPVKYERYENGTYYWQFEAVINGEIVTQEAQSKFPDTIAMMRKHQFEVVDLRYTNDIVTGVKEIPATKVYGNPFNEIKTGPVDTDNESVYDVVLALDAGTPSKDPVKFDYVWRVTPGYNFAKTERGYLNLQGRTLWVLNGQGDHGIDFVRDAKAVVRQPENGDMENRQYNSVQEAIDSLADPEVDTEVKEFDGIITAVLNSQGVAEWIVFYSDTNLDSRNNISGGAATMDVKVDVKLPGNAAYTHAIVKVSKPDDGTKLCWIDAPELDGFVAKQPKAPIVWDRDNTDPRVEFEYEAVATSVAGKNISGATKVDERLTTGGFADKGTGTYIFTDIDETYVTEGVHGEATENMFFLFTTVAASKGFTLTIKDSSGITVYSESVADNTSILASQKRYFYVQLIGDAPLANKGEGTLKTTPLTTGSYTWTIVDNDTAKNTLGSGRFNIQ